MASLPWLVGGDFNGILCLSEKVRESIRQEALMENFWITLVVCGLSDLGFLGLKFTWNNRREGTQIVL